MAEAIPLPESLTAGLHSGEYQLLAELHPEVFFTTVKLVIHSSKQRINSSEYTVVAEIRQCTKVQLFSLLFPVDWQWATL
jgi:hypothetical protein